ncbi:MAG: hypothetical protein WC718_13910 [Phycisphaerales bacterium]|jgi:hypothetical protein
MRNARQWLLVWAAGCLVGCGPTVRPDFNSPEPAARNDAIVNAAATKDRAAVPDLVRMLQSDDPATRLLAISALEVITGERLGYDPSDDEGKRNAAVARWKAEFPGRPSTPDSGTRTHE